MTIDISERAFEDAIECALLHGGPDACPGGAVMARETSPPYGEGLPRRSGEAAEAGGYHKRRPDEYDRTLCLLSRDVIDFVLATQRRRFLCKDRTNDH